MLANASTFAMPSVSGGCDRSRVPALLRVSRRRTFSGFEPCRNLGRCAEASPLRTPQRERIELQISSFRHYTAGGRNHATQLVEQAPSQHLRVRLDDGNRGKAGGVPL
jgi:hypothetical protein